MPEMKAKLCLRLLIACLQAVRRTCALSPTTLEENHPQPHMVSQEAAERVALAELEHRVARLRNWCLSSGHTLAPVSLGRFALPALFCQKVEQGVQSFDDRVRTFN